jgi:hypothetical protein
VIGSATISTKCGVIVTNMFILEDASSGEVKGVLVCTNAMTSM